MSKRAGISSWRSSQKRIRTYRSSSSRTSWKRRPRRGQAWSSLSNGAWNLVPYTALAVSGYNKQRRRLANGVAAELAAVQAAILQDPHRGDRKKEQLRNVWVEKFRAGNDQWLVAYEIDTKAQTVTFLSIGQQENFYRNLARYRDFAGEKRNSSIPGRGADRSNLRAPWTDVGRSQPSARTSTRSLGDPQP